MFFQTDSKILVIGGFAGVGKRQISEHTLSYMDKNTITLKFVCTESTKLDDIHLSFFNTLKRKTAVKNTSEIDALNTTSEKIEFILGNKDLKFIPVFYNFDAIKDENKSEILNYIFSITKKENIKTVICAKTFDTDIIPEELKYVKIMTKALSKEFFETYIREFGIKVTPAMLDQLYRLTRGYFYSACLCCKIMVNQELTVNDFIVRYTNSGEKFDTFLAKAYYKLIVGTTKSAFNLFIRMNHGLNLKVLQSIGSYPENIIKMLCENFYIYKKGDLYFPADFLKQQLYEFIDDEISKKRLASYYEKQLALPIEERDFIISRATLQDEIAICKGIELEPKESASDSSKNEASDNHPEEALGEEKQINYNNFSVNDLYNQSNDFFNKFDYHKVIELLTIVLDRKNSILGSQLLYDTYLLLAKTYAKLFKWNYAIYYYNMLESHYKNIFDDENMYNIQYEKAKVYYHSYRIIDAIQILKTLAEFSKTKRIVSGANLLMGNIAISTSNKPLAKQYYIKGIENIDTELEDELKMERYFKYAILLDEDGDMAGAIEYYNKCISINCTKSKYIALAYSNMGDLFYDNELLDDAKDCFQKAYNADKLNNNEYGMYYSLSKIIELTDKKDKDVLVKLSEEAKEHALKTDDYNALLLSVIKLGDVYYDYPEPEKALSEYLSLYREGVEVIEEPNFSMIKARIEDIRARLGKERFEELVPDYA